MRLASNPCLTFLLVDKTAYCLTHPEFLKFIVMSDSRHYLQQISHLESAYRKMVGEIEEKAPRNYKKSIVNILSTTLAKVCREQDTLELRATDVYHLKELYGLFDDVEYGFSKHREATSF